MLWDAEFYFHGTLNRGIGGLLFSIECHYSGRCEGVEIVADPLTQFLQKCELEGVAVKLQMGSCSAAPPWGD